MTDPRRIIEEGLRGLRDGLAPLVADALRAAYGAGWWAKAVETTTSTWDLEEIRKHHSPRWEGLSDSERMGALDVRNLLDAVERPPSPSGSENSGETLVVQFDGAVFRPEGRVDLRPNVRYHVRVVEALKPLDDPWAGLEALIGTVEAPEDWAAEHDHYLYGTPKRAMLGQVNERRPGGGHAR